MRLDNYELEVFLFRKSSLELIAANALGIGAASFASGVITEQAKIERKARRLAGTPKRMTKD